MDDDGEVVTPRKLNRTIGARRGPTLHISAVAGPLRESTHDTNAAVPLRFYSVFDPGSPSGPEPSPTAVAAGCAASSDDSCGRFQGGPAEAVSTLWVPVPVHKLIAVMKAFQAEVRP
jgi:hypothetical protein